HACRAPMTNRLTLQAEGCAAVDGEGLAGDETRGVAQEEERGGSGIVQRADERSLRRGHILFTDRAEDERVAADMVLREFTGGLLSQSDDAGFAGDKADAFGTRTGRAEVKDRAAACIGHDAAK